MTEFIFRSDMDVDLVNFMGTDATVVAAARVSVVGAQAQSFENDDAAEHKGLITYLMTHRHGTPFEHATVCMRISGPISAFREFHRHRVGWSYNEWSARYSVLAPVFHIPGPDRPLINAGSSARPLMVAGTKAQYEGEVASLKQDYTNAYNSYLDSLERGTAKEIARQRLPVGIYSTMYATCNMRSLMHFLGLRTDVPEATFPSKPQYEIAQIAAGMESIFEDLWPVTYNAWNTHGRVSP